MPSVEVEVQVMLCRPLRAVRGIARATQEKKRNTGEQQANVVVWRGNTSYRYCCDFSSLAAKVVFAHYCRLVDSAPIHADLPLGTGIRTLPA